MVKKRKTPEEVRADGAERSKRLRITCAQATGPQGDARRRKQQQQARDRQARSRERARLDRPVVHTTFHMPETPARSPPPFPPFLPPHQTDAIHAFFDRLQLAQTDIDECTICHECFHGIRMQGSVCDRCSREVRVVFPPSVLFFLPLSSPTARYSSFFRPEQR